MGLDFISPLTSLFLFSIKHRNKEDFCKKYNFSITKPTLLICSAWGFVDSSPDLHIDDLDDAKKDIEGRDRQLAMIRQLIAMRLKEKWNILLSVHPGVVQQPYKELCKELDIPLDTASRIAELTPSGWDRRQISGN